MRGGGRAGQSDLDGGNRPAGAAGGDDRRPSGADDTEAGAPDDLKLIRGVGPKNEAILNGIGVRRFGQIADWSDANARWVSAHMSVPGRVEREALGGRQIPGGGLDTGRTFRRCKNLVASSSTRAPIRRSARTRPSHWRQSLPEQAARVRGRGKPCRARPLGLADARGDSADNLKLIKGSGPRTGAPACFGRLAFRPDRRLTPENVKWIGSYLAFSGRIDRENWIEQARALSGGKPAAEGSASRLI